MSKQTTASEHWEHSQRMERITVLMRDCKDYTFPAGQMQAGMQLGTVEVPWLLNYIESLKEQINGTAQESQQTLAA